MAYLKFNKAELVNLEYALKREICKTNTSGAYASSTIVGCNTRKYHGLLVVPVKEFGDENHVLLSGIDETLIQHGQAFNLGIHNYGSVYEPRGHKYIVDFEVNKAVVTTYRVGGVVFSKEAVFLPDEDQILLRYTLLEAHSPTTLRLKPFLAFRNAHSLTAANMEANTKYQTVENGICSNLYAGFPDLYMQLSLKNEFVSNPDWYFGVTYQEELRRGFAGSEDLFVPGYFELPIKKGQSVVFSASLKKMRPTLLKGIFDKALADAPDCDSYKHCLDIAARQCMVSRNGQRWVMAGYPWGHCVPRDTFIALPGLSLSEYKDEKAYKEVLQNIMYKGPFQLKTADASLWYFWTLQQYLATGQDAKALWKEYGPTMKSILEAYHRGNEFINLHENGLIWAEAPGKALTWMNATVNGQPVTPRPGYQVEVNALWYNALMFSLELASLCGDTEFVEKWQKIPEKTRDNFLRAFWVEERQHLADYVGPEGQNIFMRPNQLFACSLPYSPISDEIKAKVLKAIERELLTPKGLRTLSPKNPLYMGLYEGDQATRDKAYHQGTVRPWLIGHYIDACLKLRGPHFVAQATELLKGFEEDIAVHGICSIAEVYDGDPPHQPHGCPSAAASVAEVLRSLYHIQMMQSSDVK